MRAKHNFMIIFLSLLGAIQVKGQDCDLLIQEAIQQQNNGKFEKAEKTLDLFDDKDCDDKKLKKLRDNIRQPMTAYKKERVKTSVLTLSYDTIQIPYPGGEFPIVVSGANKWKAKVESEWCTVKKEGYRLIIKCIDTNPTMKDRIAKVKVTSDKGYKTITVINEGAPEMLRSSVNSLSFPRDGGIDEVAIYSNTEWGIDSLYLPKWLVYERSGSFDNTRLAIRVEPNNQPERRECSIVLRSDSSNVVINVSQGAGKEELASSKNDLIFGIGGGAEYIKIYTNAGKWDLWKSTWCDVERIGEDSLKISCDPNNNYWQREGSVNIHTGAQTISINISQEAKPFPYMVPAMGIGGRSLSFGINAGMVVPMISASADGFTGSAVSYALGNNDEAASYKPGVGFTIGLFADIRLYRNIYLIAGINYLQYSYKNEFKSDVYEKIYQTQSYYRGGITQNKYWEEYTMRQLELPILGSYRFPITPKSHIQINAGPIFNYGLSAKLNISGFTDSETMRAYTYNGNIAYEDFSVPHSLHYSGNGELNLYDKKANYCIDESGRTEEKSRQLEDSPLNRFNVGLRLGCVYEYHGLSFGVDFTYCLSNMARDKFWNGERWKIFENNDIDSKMTNYRQRNHYLGIKLGYTLRY